MTSSTAPRAQHSRTSGTAWKGRTDREKGSEMVQRKSYRDRMPKGRAYPPFTVRIDYDLVGLVLAEKMKLAGMPLEVSEVRR